MFGLLKSRKFIYAITTLIISLVYALVPTVIDLDADSLAMLKDWLPVTASVIVMAVGGHILQDYTTTKNNVQVLPLGEAITGVIEEAQPLPDRDPHV